MGLRIIDICLNCTRETCYLDEQVQDLNISCPVIEKAKKDYILKHRRSDGSTPSLVKKRTRRKK